MIITKSLPSFSLTKAASLFLNNTCRTFSSDILNHRVQAVDPSSGKPNDRDPVIAYLQKRRLKRSQVWAKIRILEDAPLNQMQHLKYQKLHEVRRLLQEDMIKKIIQQDPTQINSTFIISVFSQQYFKQLIDQYVNKVLICGKAPSQQSKQIMNELQKRVNEIFKMYYFGEKLTPLQRQIQFNYLAAKQQKYRAFMISNKKNIKYACTWTQQDQRLLEDYVNWPQVQLNLSDLSNRPFYLPMNIFARKAYAQKFYELIGGNDLFSSFSFGNRIKKSYEYSAESMNWIKQKLFSRTIQYTKCLQFTQTMKIPPDFTIQLLVLNAHCWMITDRLKQINTKKAVTLALMIDQMFSTYVDQLLGSLNMKKLAVMQRNFQQMMSIARSNLNFHFNGFETTSKNPYFSIDALVWSIIMNEKVERFSDEVYLFSQYLIKNRQYLKNLHEEDFMNGMCEFDCFFIDPDYRKKITQINPQLSKAEYLEQRKSNKGNKQYYYGSRLNGVDLSQIQRMNNSIQDTKYSYVGVLFQKIFNFIKKYLTTMDNYDHFNRMDQQKVKIQLKDKKSPWKSEKDKIKQADEQFNTINKIRTSRVDPKTSDSPKNQQKHKK